MSAAIVAITTGAKSSQLGSRCGAPSGPERGSRRASGSHTGARRCYGLFVRAVPASRRISAFSGKFRAPRELTFTLSVVFGPHGGNFGRVLRQRSKRLSYRLVGHGKMRGLAQHTPMRQNVGVCCAVPRQWCGQIALKSDTGVKIEGLCTRVG